MGALWLLARLFKILTASFLTASFLSALYAVTAFLNICMLCAAIARENYASVPLRIRFDL